MPCASCANPCHRLPLATLVKDDPLYNAMTQTTPNLSQMPPLSEAELETNLIVFSHRTRPPTGKMWAYGFIQGVALARDAWHPEHRPTADAMATPVKRPGPKVGRIDPCPCGSGKKYKKCCGAN